LMGGDESSIQQHYARGWNRSYGSLGQPELV
jgi:hypothetical protein